MNIKILVCYHKKDRLFKNDVLVPIHCGRAVAKEKHKDGQISNEDYNWLLDNMIGDDTGDNISNLNREVNEMTAVYWAWKNYEKLGNPDYIGLCHYRRLFNFAGKKYYKNKKEISYKSGQNQKIIQTILNQCDFITRTPFNCDDLIIENMLSFQDIIKLSEKNYPELYKSFQQMKKSRLYYCNNMFVMKREDFFEYCKTIFPIMFDFIKIENRGELFIKNITKKVNKDILDKYDGGRVWIPRLTGFLMEYITNFYLIYMMHNKKHIEIDVLNTEECKRHKKIYFIKKLFSINRENINDVPYRTLCVLGLTIKIKRIKNA